MTWILPKQLHTLASALDTEALSLDLNEQSQVCAQSLFVRSKPSPSAIWLRKWKRDSWTQHLSGRILKPSLGQRFATEWTSSLGATHASPSVQPANVKVSKTRGIFGRLLQMAFDFSDPAAASLRTSKDISAWGCPTSSKTWQEWVIERRGAYSQRLNAERLTRESESSSWPTAATRDYKGQSGSGRQERKGHPADTLPNAMAQWPSPVASDVRQGFQDRSRGMKGSQESLTTVVVKSWPTPNCMDVITPNRDLTQMESKGHWGKNMNTGKLSEMVNYGPPAPASSSTDGSRPGLWQTATVSTGAHKQKDGSMTDKLDQQVKSWATPSAFDGQRPIETQQEWEARNARKKEQNPNLGQLHKPLTVQMTGGGKLNPRWVETLMGLPVGWTMPSCASPVTIERTNSDYSETASSQQQQNEPSGL